MQINYRTSTNGGATWSAESALAANGYNGRDQFFPCVSSTAPMDGTTGTHDVAVMWLDRRNDASDIKFDSYVSHWTTSWATALRLSTSSSDPTVTQKSTALGGEFLGDYTGCGWWYSSEGTGQSEYFVGVWPDTSNGTTVVGMLGGYKF
jgi:hypothetical protein